MTDTLTNRDIHSEIYNMTGYAFIFNTCFPDLPYLDTSTLINPVSTLAFRIFPLIQTQLCSKFVGGQN